MLIHFFVCIYLKINQYVVAPIKRAFILLNSESLHIGIIMRHSVIFVFPNTHLYKSKFTATDAYEKQTNGDIIPCIFWPSRILQQFTKS